MIPTITPVPRTGLPMQQRPVLPPHVDPLDALPGGGLGNIAAWERAHRRDVAKRVGLRALENLGSIILAAVAIYLFIKFSPLPF